LSLYVGVGKVATLTTTSKNAVLPWHKVRFLMDVLVVVNLQAFLAMQVIHLGPALDGVNLVMGHSFCLLCADIVEHFAPLKHPLGDVAFTRLAHLENFADLGGEVLEFVPE